MIAKLSGVLDSVASDHAVVDVNGVGYLVACSARTLDRLPKAGEPVTLAIETQVREDAINLYGFGEESEREWFRLLVTVQGVGARHALAILGAVPTDDLARAIVAQDKATISRANGVGPKLAQRIASELKDKIGDIALGAAGLPPAVDAAVGGAVADAISALVNLGYRRAEAQGAVARAAHDMGGEPATGDLVRAGLKELAT